MATFDGNGLVIDRLADIKTEMQNEIIATFGDGVNLAETSTFGVLVGILSERYYLLWEKLEAVYLASFPEQSYGVYLDELCAFNGVVREPATKSIVDLEFTRSNAAVDGDVLVPAGTQCNAVGSSTYWTTLEDATILDTELTAITSASPVEYGPVGAVQDSIIEMVSAPANVGEVNNPDGAELGVDEESDAELKNRRITELGRIGTPTEAGIRSALQLLDTVAKATIVLNDSDLTVDGQPPHSVHCYVDIVESSSLDQPTRDEIAQTIWDSKGGGINTDGTLNGIAVDTNGDDQVVNFDEIETKYIFTKVYITRTDDYNETDSEAAIAAAIQEFSELELRSGVDVLNYKVEGAATNVGAAGITYLRTEISIEDVPLSYSSDNIEVPPEEVAFLDSDSVSFDYIYA